MNIRLCLLEVALVLPQAVLPQMSQGALATSGDLRGTTSRVEIPFKLYGGYLIVVQGSLGTLQNLNLLIDTGANPTVIDRRIAKKLQLTGRSQKLALSDQNADVRQVVLPALQLGHIRAKSLPAVIQDLSAFENILGFRVDASIGFGVLGLSSFSIDYRSKKIVFGPIESSPLAVRFDTGPPVLTVQVQVQDRPTRLLVDTGAAELVLFECRLHGRLDEPVGSVRRFFNGASKELELKEL